MPNQAWTRDGKILLDGGAVVLCADCPCVEAGPETVPCSVFTAEPPRFITLRIPGAANQDCSICAVLSESHTLEYDASLSGPNGCHWRKVLSPGNCAYTTLDVEVRTIGMSVTIEAFIDDIAYGFLLTIPGSATVDLDEYTLPLSFDFSSQCDMSAATAVVDFTVE